MSSFPSDLVSALRRLLASPAHAAAVVLAVALATAAAAAVFSVVQAVLLRPLPFREPDRLVWIWATRTDRDKAFFAAADFLDHRAAGRALRDAAAFTPWASNLAGPQGRERLQGARVTANAFELLGVQAVLGRTLQPSDASESAARAVVLSHGLWQRRFGGSPAAVGATLVLNDESYRVVGVLGPDFLFPGVPAEMVGVIDVERDPRRGDRGTNFLRVFGRLAPGATREQVAQEWGRTTRELRERFPDTNAKKTEPRVLTLAQEMLGEHRASLLALLGAVLTVALLACVNIAALSALRAFAREGELAVRRALGASGLDLARLLALETGALVAAGGVFGLVLARAALGAVVAIVPVTLPRAHDAAIDWSVVGAVLLAAGVTAGLCACLPLVTRAGAGAEADTVALRLGTRASDPPGRQRLRRGLAVLQVAAAFVLLVATALHLETYRRLQAEGPGVRTDGLVQVRLSLPPRAYPDQPSLETYVTRLRQSLLAEPGVEAVAVASALPLSGYNARSDFVILGREPRSAAEMPGGQLRWVSPGFTEALKLPVRRGRPIDEGDQRSHAAVGLVDERLARLFWSDADPVGTSIRLEASAVGSGPVFQIVGVVGNVKHFDLADAPLGTLYLPLHGLTPTLRGSFASGFTVAVAGRVDGGVERDRIAEAVRRVDSEVSASTMSTMREALARSQAARRFSSGVLSVFAATALLLAASGLYSLVAAAAHARRREWGVRLALGASPSSVTRALLRGAAGTLAVGLAAGAPVALVVLGALGRGIAPELESRPSAWLGIPIALTAATLLAVLPPALRAARVDVARILGDS
jgi:putative ABC transport system permease protein